MPSLPKRWLIGAVLLALLVGLAWMFLKVPAYEASVKLRVGQVSGQGPFEAPEVLSARLLAEHGEVLPGRHRSHEAYLRRAAPARGVPGVIDLVASASSPDDAAALLQRVTSEVLERHGEVHARNVKALGEHLNALLAERDVSRRQFAESGILLERIRDSNPVQASLIALERSRLAQALAETNAEIPKLTRELSPPNTSRTAMLGAIESPAYPSGPRTWLVVLMFIFFGLLLGGLLAFIVEFLGRGCARGKRA